MAQREFAHNTRAAFRNDLKLFLAFMDAQTPLSACSPARLQAFLDYLQTGREAPCSGKTLDRRITTLKVFFGWLAAKEVLRTDPAAPLEHVGSSSPLPQILTEGQLDQVLTLTRQMRDAADSPDARPHLLITLLLDTALKKTECLNLALEDVDVSDPAHPSINIRYERPRQRFKARRLAVSAEWAQTLERYLRRYQPTDKLFECTGRNLEYLLHTIATVAYLPFALTFDMLRWTSAARSLKAGMEPDHLRRRLGLSRLAWQAAWPILQKLAQGPL
jgi:integrase/recombinase XerD